MLKLCALELATAISQFFFKYLSNTGNYSYMAGILTISPAIGILAGWEGGALKGPLNLRVATSGFHIRT